MAIYKRDIVDINLETGNIHRSFLNHSIGYMDQKADHFGIRVYRDGQPVDLTGVSVQGIFMPPQGAPIAITSGNIVSGNTAEVVLPQACYNYDGQFCLSIKLVDGTNSITGTMRIVDGVVDNTHASGTVAPTSAVPTYQEILAVYDEMVEATAVANSAIAEAYSSSNTYKVGDYVIHDGGLYQCTTAITTAEAWTEAHWEIAKIGPDVSVIKRETTETELESRTKHAIFFNSGTIATDDVGETITFTVTDNQYYSHAIVPVKKSDIVEIVSGAGGSTARLWCIVDDELVVQAVAAASETAEGELLYIEKDGYVVLNVNNSSPTPEAYKIPVQKVDNVKSGVLDYADNLGVQSESSSYFDLADNMVQGYINTNADYSQPITPTVSTDSTFECMFVKTNKYDQFVITGVGGTNARLWAFTDDQYNLVSKSAKSASASALKIIAPCDGYLFINATTTSNPVVNKLVSNKEMMTFQNESYGFISYYGIKTNVGVGNTISLTPDELQEASYCVIDVSVGDRIRFWGRGFSAYRAWCFVDESLKVVSVSGESITYDGILVSPTNGKLILNVRNNQGIYAAKEKRITAKDVIESMNGGKHHQFLSAIIPDKYEPTAGSFGPISDVVNVTAPTVASIYNLYEALMEAHPDYITRGTLPYTDQSGTYPMRVYTFMPETIPTQSEPHFALPPLPKVILGGGVHGLGTSGDDCSMIGTLYYFLRDLCENWENNEALKFLRWNVVFKVIPLQNPWAIENQSRKNSRGVDINRNMPFNWLYSTDTTAAGYGGTAPLSENESKNIKYLFDNNRDALIYFDIHSRIGTVAQNRMMYFDTLEYSPFVNVYRNIIPTITAEWKKINSNVSGTMCGFADLLSAGVGQINCYASSLGMYGSVIEGFSNFSGSGLEDYSEDITEMLLTYFGSTLLQALRFFSGNCYPGGSRIYES